MIMDKKLNEILDNLIPTKLATILYSTSSYSTIKYKHICKSNFVSNDVRRRYRLARALCFNHFHYLSRIAKCYQHLSVRLVTQIKC